MNMGKFGWHGAKGGFGKQMGQNGQTQVEPVIELNVGEGAGRDTATGSAGSSYTYTDEALSELVFMIEEEKLAGDIYDAFYDAYGLAVFKNIGASEDAHEAALLDQAEKIGVDVDDIVLLPAGEYVNDELQEMYDTLLAQGLESLTAALEVGVAIETKDMTDIAEAAEAVEGSTLAKVYDNLLTGSAYHLEAFEGLL